MQQFYVVASEEFSLSTLGCDCLAHSFGNAADHQGQGTRYTSDMSDAEWAVVRQALPTPAWMEIRGGRPEGHCHRQMFDAIRSLGHVRWRGVTTATVIHCES